MLLLRYPAAENQEKGNEFILQGERLRTDITMISWLAELINV